MEHRQNADDRNMDPRLRAKRLRVVGKLLKHVPSERIPELENFVMGLLPEEPEEDDAETIAIAEEICRMMEARARLAAIDPGNVKYKQ